jgi:predicted dehydrogenase
MPPTPRLKLGLLGLDPQIAAVAAAALAAGDQIALACDVPEGMALLADRRQRSWQALLDEQSCDAVLVAAGGWNPDRAEGVRMLVQAGRTLLVAQPAELSMLWAYELDMIRRDTGARIVPALADRLHPFIARLRAVIVAGRAGVASVRGPESLTLVRGMADRSRDAVLAQLARDADLVRVLAGDPARLSTLADGPPDAAWPTLAVGLGGAGQLPVRWQVTGRARSGLTIALQHAAGTITVGIPDEPDEPWTWRGENDAEAPDDDSLPPATWADASRAIELAETVPRSLARGRAIDLHREEFSEIGTFKGTMASLGCGIVLVGLLVMLLAAVAGVVLGQMKGNDQQPARDLLRQVVGAWPVVLLVLMLLFLAVQFLPALTGIDRNDDDR